MLQDAAPKGTLLIERLASRPTAKKKFVYDKISLYCHRCWRASDGSFLQGGVRESGP